MVSVVRLKLEGVQQTDRALRALAQSMPRQASRALNATARRVNTRVRRQTAKELNIVQKHIRDRFKFFRATPQDLSASVWVGTKTRIKYRDLPGTVSSMSGSFVKHRGRFIKTFKARMPSGYTGQFVRKPNSRHKRRPDGQWTELPIEEPGIRLAPIAKPILLTTSQTEMREFYPKELRRLVFLANARRTRR